MQQVVRDRKLWEVGGQAQQKLSNLRLRVSMCRVGQNHIYIRCIYGIFGREITKYTVIYGVHVRFYQTLDMCGHSV